MNLAKRQNFIFTVTTTAYDYSYDGYDNGGPSATLRQEATNALTPYPPSPDRNAKLFFSFLSFLHDNILFLETCP